MASSANPRTLHKDTWASRLCVMAICLAAALLATAAIPSPSFADEEADNPDAIAELIEPTFEDVNFDAAAFEDASADGAALENANQDAPEPASEDADSDAIAPASDDANPTTPPSDETAVAPQDDMEALAVSVTDQPLWEATQTTNIGQVRALSNNKDLVIIAGICAPSASGYDSTEYLVNKIKEDLSGSDYSNVQYIVMDMGGKDTSRPYASWTTSKISVCARGGQWGSDYWNWAKTNYKKATGDDLTWGSLPVYFVVRQGNIVSTSKDRWDLGLNIANSIGYSSDKYASYTLALRGTLNQKEAQELLYLVNEARRAKGVAALQWDADMERTAIQRAAELSLIYAHERPDGRSVYTAWPSKYQNTSTRAGAENIAVLSASTPEDDAEGINDAWTASSGHYKNMVNERYKSFGAACFIDANGLGHWVECFSSLNGTNTTAGTDGEYWTFVGARPYVLGGLHANFGLGEQVILAPGEQLDLGSRAYVSPWESNPEHQTYVRSTFVKPEWYPWKSSDPSVASVGQTEGVAGLVTANDFGTTTITMKAADQVATLNVIVGYDMTKATISSIPDKEYTGKAITPTPTVTCNGKTLKKGTDYTLSYENNKEVSNSYASNYRQAQVTIKGLGNYVGEQTVTFSIVRADISKATVSSIPKQTQSHYGEAMRPEPTVKLNGRTLVKDDDYTLSYWNNDRGGTATLSIHAWGSYTGSKDVKFTVVAWQRPSDSGSSGSDSGSSGSSSSSPAKSVTWTRLAGDNAFKTMSKVIDAGKFAKGGTVVLASLEGYWDALTAAGIAGLEKAPVVMSTPDGLSAEAKAQLKKLAPKKIVVCGGTYWLPQKVLDAAKAAAGTSPAVVRLAGSNAAATAEKIAAQGKGKWSGTAIVATAGTFQDALAAAPIAWAKKMPIFLAQFDFAKESGYISQSTIKAMKDAKITKCYIAGGTYWIPKQVEDDLKAAGITVIKRLGGKTAVETSGLIAREAVSALGMKANAMGVANVAQHYDALASASFCGKNNSVLVLVKDSRSSVISGFVKSHKANMTKGYVFGGTGSVSEASMNALKAATK